MKAQPPASVSNDALVQTAIPPKVVIILAEQPDPKSNVLRFQDYHRDGKSFIPIFRSKESFQQSTRGQVDKPLYRIDRRLLISVLKGPETLILDPSLPDEIVTSGNDLKRLFPEPFELEDSPPPMELGD